jgi:hypothetical protein
MNHLKPIRLEKISGGFDAFWENGVELGQILCDVDGFYKYWPIYQGGYYDEWFLLSMADTLKELNKKWQEEIDNDPVFGLRNDNTQHGESL